MLCSLSVPRVYSFRQVKMAAKANVRFLILFLAVGGDAQSRIPMPLPTPVSVADLCVTEGAVTQFPHNLLSVATPRMRAYFNRPTSRQAEAQFAYLGPTASQIPLGSDQLRRQFGLKLRAQDACNAVYA